MRPDTATARVATGLRIAAGAYVAAWIVGLLIAPTGPPTGATAAGIHAYYLAHRLPLMAQSLLVHGIAGVALAALVLGLRRRQREEGRAGGLEGAALLAGVVAAGLSLLQVAIQVVLVAQLSTADAAAVADLRNAIDLVDGVKLIALGLLVAGTLPSPLLPSSRSLRALGTVLASTLWLGAVSLLVVAPPLTAALYVSLPLLLVWVLAVAVLVRTGRSATGGPNKAPTQTASSSSIRSHGR